MSRNANPYDNALAESVMKTLKHEEMLAFDYDAVGQEGVEWLPHVALKRLMRRPWPHAVRAIRCGRPRNPSRLARQFTRTAFTSSSFATLAKS